MSTQSYTTDIPDQNFFIFSTVSYAVSLWALIFSNHRQTVIIYIPITDSICCKEFQVDTLQYSQETINIVLNSYVEVPAKMYTFNSKLLERFGVEVQTLKIVLWIIIFIYILDRHITKNNITPATLSIK